MKIRPLLFILTFFVIPLFQGSLPAQELTTATPEEVGMSSERLEYLSSVFQDYVDDEKLAGSVILVARKGKIAYFGTFGEQDMEQNIPMSKHSIFRIASQTKAIVSVGIMILQEEGKLLISDPVGKYIPEYYETTVAVPNDDGGYEIVDSNRDITIRDLLTHTAGVGYGTGIARDQWEEAGITGWYFGHREEPIRETVKRMASLPFDAQPGERYVYGYSTDILGAVIEAASGMTLDQFLKDRILDPLGMEDTHFYLPTEKADRLATVYSATEDGIVRTPDGAAMRTQGQYLEGPRVSFSGGAGYLSTAEDYAVFLQMMLNGGSYNGTRVLSRKTVELMTVDHIGDDMFPWDPGVGFGLGFSVVKDLGARGALGSVGEFAWGGAYHSTYWVDPAEDLVVVYFTQLIPARGLDDHDKLRALIYQAIAD